MKINAKAKINLSLNVLGVLDGFHQLESVVSEINLSDSLTVKKSKDISVDYGKSFSIEQEKDNAYKACKLFREEFNVGGAKIKIKKRIPAKAGLGGSSADAVGVIVAMQRLYGIKNCQRLQELLAKIGSDCPVQYAGGYNMMSGRGERVEHISSQKKLYLVILTEPNGVNTAECFSLCDKMQTESSDNKKLVEFLEGRGKLPELKNALYLPATQLNPKVKENYELLKKYFDRVNMSGSGSAVYGVSENKKQAKAVYKKLKALGKKVILTNN